MIWCVEDDASIRDVEVYALRSTGMEARGFEDGTSFWEALQQEKPTLVILDVMLPGIDGIELLRRMRRDDTPTQPFRRYGRARHPAGQAERHPDAFAGRSARGHA